MSDSRPHSVYLVTDAGALELRPGRSVVARVERIAGDTVLLAIAGSRLEVRSTARLCAGDVVRLEAEALADGRVALRVVAPGGTRPAADRWSA